MTEVRHVDFDEAAIAACDAALKHEDIDSLCGVLVGHRVARGSFFEQRGAILDRYAAMMIPRSREKWNRQVGDFLCFLGLTRPAQTAEEFLSHWDWNTPFEEFALMSACANLRSEAAKGSKLTKSYSSELCSIGWRGTYLACLAELLRDASEGPRLLAAILAGNDATEEAVALRSRRFRELAQAAPQRDPLNEVTGLILWRVYTAYKRSLKAKEIVDPALLLFAEIERDREREEQ